jgi:hypothetical protein
MKINLVHYGMNFTNTILGKFAWRMSEQLDKLNIKNVVKDGPDSSYDVNHHINYLPYRHVDSINTLLVTHIDTEKKLNALANALKSADMAICMSQQTVDELVKKGLPPEKLTFVLPAHDEDMAPIPVAILTKVYSDGRKRESMLNELAKHIDRKRFIFRIMGQNWDIPALEKLGLIVEYYPNFDRNIHQRILQDSKYYLYMGLDEGSMGTVDAKRAGLKTISTPQGFHTELGLDYAFMTQEELNKIFLEIQKPALEDWTWENYTKKHVAIWEKLCAAR